MNEWWIYINNKKSPIISKLLSMHIKFFGFNSSNNDLVLKIFNLEYKCLEVLKIMTRILRFLSKFLKYLQLNFII